MIILITNINLLSNYRTEIPELYNPELVEIKAYYPSALTSPLFTLDMLTNQLSTNFRENICLEVKEDLEAIGIGVNLNSSDWTYVTDQLLNRNEYDMFFVGLYAGILFDPDWSHLFAENGSLSACFGYDTSMDYNSTYGTGLNQWYLEQGRLMMPPNSTARINHYWEWQEYFMNEILSYIPGFYALHFESMWSNLNGYNATEGLLKSLGKMSWSGSHLGQASTSEVVLTDWMWLNLNPLRHEDEVEVGNTYIKDALMDRLVYYDRDLNVYPHIISDWNHINDTHVRLTVRDGIKWQTDPDSLFPNEYLDARDVYFSLFSYKNLANITKDWIDEIEIIDDHTVDLFIDENISTITNDPYCSYLREFNDMSVLPEHYLNQTQLADGITPNMTHSSWTKFNTQAFGTGPFELSAYLDYDHTNLTLFNDSWWFNATVNNDPRLDFTQRFGDFSGGISDLRIMVYYDETEIHNEFEAGRLDLIDISDNQTKKIEYSGNSNYDIQTKIRTTHTFWGINVRESRGTPMQSMDPCPLIPGMTVGLAVRKAIAHAIDKDSIASLYVGANGRSN